VADEHAVKFLEAKSLLFSGLRLYVVDSDPERGETFLQLFATCSGSVPGCKFCFHSAINLERIT
jgi:hypothetical protein